MHNHALSGEPAIQVEGITKSYVDGSRVVPALCGISFAVQRGEIYAFLGPNGSGKTTTLNILSHLCEPDAGTVRLQGRALGDLDYHRGVAFVSGTAQFLWTYSAREILVFYAKLFQTSVAVLDEIVTRFDFDEKQHRKWHQLSSGEQMKVRIMRALLADPAVLLLDEPTVGLDPDSAQQFRSILSGLRDRGVTILITSHLMKDIEVLADRVLFIHNGKLKAEGPLASFRRPREFVHVRFKESVGALPDGVIPLGAGVYQAPLERLREVLTLGAVQQVNTVEETLEDYFVSLVRG